MSEKLSPELVAKKVLAVASEVPQLTKEIIPMEWIKFGTILCTITVPMNAKLRELVQNIKPPNRRFY
ncbi:MAG: hypothetical protein Q8O38_17290 [Sulfurimicrobium sp.]|nr:hypothetical protein [Sulfurimicrobium sp.]